MKKIRTALIAVGAIAIAFQAQAAGLSSFHEGGIKLRLDLGSGMPVQERDGLWLAFPDLAGPHPADSGFHLPKPDFGLWDWDGPFGAGRDLDLDSSPDATFHFEGDQEFKLHSFHWEAPPHVPRYSFAAVPDGRHGGSVSFDVTPIEF